jgi:hypothetical protein
MSADFRPRDCMLASELFDERLRKFGIYKHGRRYVTDGRGNYLFVEISDDGYAVEFTARHCDPSRILIAICEVFKTRIWSEDDPQFWGSGTWEKAYAGVR